LCTRAQRKRNNERERERDEKQYACRFMFD